VAMHHNALRLFATMLVVLGLLTLGVAPAAAQEALTVQVTFDQTTVDPRTGQVTLSGTVTCSEPARVEILGDLRQEVGRIFTVRSFFGTGFVYCPGPEGTTFSRTVTSIEGRFAPGPASLMLFIFGCVLDPLGVGCIKTFEGRLDTTIRLAPAH
jgi:hypothetical protein